MKKSILVGSMILAVASMKAQKFGVTGGLALMSGKVKVNDQSATDSQTGGYLGLFGEFGIAQKWKFVPGINYIMMDGSGGLQIPLIFKYSVADKFNLQAGPQILFDTTKTPAEYSDYYNKTNLAVALGAGYDFSEKFFGDVRYSIQLNNHFKNVPSNVDASAKINVLNIGVGYKF